MPVRASGEKLLRSSSSEPDLVVPVEVVGRERHQPGVDARRRRASSLPITAARRVERVVVGPRSGVCQPRQAVGHREPAVVGVGERERRPGRSSSVDASPSSMSDRSAASDQLGQHAGEAAPRLDERDQGAGRQVEPLERARPQQPDLADQPVLGVGAQRAASAREHRGGVARGRAAPRCRSPVR